MKEENINNVKYINQSAACPMAFCNHSNTCARHAHYLKAVAEADTYEVINIQRLQPDATSTCPYYLVTKKIRMAWGFRRIYDTIPHGNAKHLYMCTPYPVRRFYKAKNAEIPIEPEMQQILLNIFKQNGADISIGFDRYEEKEVLVEG